MRPYVLLRYDDYEDFTKQLINVHACVCVWGGGSTGRVRIHII